MLEPILYGKALYAHFDAIVLGSLDSSRRQKSRYLALSCKTVRFVWKLGREVGTVQLCNITAKETNNSDLSGNYPCFALLSIQRYFSVTLKQILLLLGADIVKYLLDHFSSLRKETFSSIKSFMRLCQ